MKQLRGVRLVNWYHFADQTFRFDGSALLLGDNGSGKSTVLDAIQLAVVANEAQVRFNKAANERSRRGLYGYVRWKLGSEDETRPGQVRFGRGAATSYVLLRFDDTENPTESFTCGLCLEATESDSQVTKWPIVLVGAELADVPVLDSSDRVRPMRDFRVVVRETPGHRPCPDLGTYREELRHRLGLLPESFHRLIVKALDWKPIGQVREFVFGFLLDERPVDTGSLQANLDNYKRLEAEAGLAEKRIAELGRICSEGERISHERRTAESHNYLSLSAGAELATETLATHRESLEKSIAVQSALEAERVRIGEQIEFLSQEQLRIAATLTKVPSYERVQSLERDIERTRVDLANAEKADGEARRQLAVQVELLDMFLSDDARALRCSRPDLTEGSDILGVAEVPPIVERLRSTLSRTGSLGGRDLRTWSDRVEKAVEIVRRAEAILGLEVDALKREGRELEKEREDLDRGRQRYRDSVEALLHLLCTRLKAKRQPQPLCELVDVVQDRWRDAVEGLLNTRRFDVIVAPEDFPRALSLYEQHKFGYALPGRGSVDIANVGLVDIERIHASHPRVERRSLAEQVVTEDPLARSYIDFVLGDVMCVDSENELRKHRRAITASVMVYQGHVARQTPAEVYRRHFIGQAARVRRLEEVGQRLAIIAESLIGTVSKLAFLGRLAALGDRARRDVVQLPQLVEEAERAPDYRAQMSLLEKQLGAIDRGEIESLEADRVAAQCESKKLGERQAQVSKEIGVAEERSRQLNDKIGEAASDYARAQAAHDELVASIDPERATAYGERYQRERGQRTAAEIRDVFDRQRRIIHSRVEGIVHALVALKVGYVNNYGFTGEVTGEAFEEFRIERELWQDSRLPDYRSRIGHAKQEAIQQLAEDIIFRLRENLVGVRRQLHELNQALRDVTFGADRYQFTAEPAKDRRDFYDLIMEAGQFEKDSLFGAAALNGAETKRTLEELFDRLVVGEARVVKEELEARADYREYFTYDMKIHHADGSVSSYDRVVEDKSGGETQTPYYVAIFASMYRLYRSHALSGGRPTCGLLLLDEAFSKMDEGRISATLSFARTLGLQLVLATPKERSELVAPHVETSMYIHKDALSGEPTVLDFSKELSNSDSN